MRRRSQCIGAWQINLDPIGFSLTMTRDSRVGFPQVCLVNCLYERMPKVGPHTYTTEFIGLPASLCSPVNPPDQLTLGLDPRGVHSMPPQHNSHQGYSGWGAGQMPTSPPATQNPLYSPYPADQSFQAQPPHLASQVHNGGPQQLTAPGAPRFVNVPLPQPNSFASWGAPPVPAQSPSDDVFPIDLTNPVDFHRLARVLDNVSISEHATVYVYRPGSRDRCLLQVPMQGRRLTTFSFIQYLQATMRKPLTKRDFTTLLSSAGQQQVHQHFLAMSRNGKQLWDGFVRGIRASRGPKGVILLQGHHYLWGFSEDQHGQWIMHVDVPTPQEVQGGHQFQHTFPVQ